MNESGKRKDDLEKALFQKQAEKRQIEKSAEDVTRDIKAYNRELDNAKIGGTKQNKRAILIICQSIDDLKKIEAYVRRRFTRHQSEGESGEYRVYTYDRAYRLFEKDKLEAGDIVIATNIAGRGLDLGVTSEVEKNGGLHVIMTYIANSVRIEKQGFGRTARKGNLGTGTYIVYDPRVGKRDVDDLRSERDEIERQRLRDIQSKKFHKVRLEDDLFKEFNKLRIRLEELFKARYAPRSDSLIRGVKSFFEGQDKEAAMSEKLCELQMASLNNKWAMWLNQMDEKLATVHVSLDRRREIMSEFRSFESKVEAAAHTRPFFGLVDESGEFNKMARIFLVYEQYGELLRCLDEVIRNHKPFSEIAQYYKAFAVIHLDGGGYESKFKAKEALKASLRMLESQRSRILSQNQILDSINRMCRRSGMGTGPNFFAKQNEGEAQVLGKHIDAIKGAIGCEVSADSFCGPGISGEESQKIFDGLLKEDCCVLKPVRISKKIVIGSRIKEQSEEARKAALLVIQDKLENSKQIIAQSSNQLIATGVGEIVRDLGRKLELCKDLQVNTKTMLCKHLLCLTYKKYMMVASPKYKNYDDYRSVIEILIDAGILAEQEIFQNDNEQSIGEIGPASVQISFPEVFRSAKSSILGEIDQALIMSSNNNWRFKDRVKSTVSFASHIYTKDRFMSDASDIVNETKVVKIHADVQSKLMGKLDHPCFRKAGSVVKKVLVSKIEVEKQEREQKKKLIAVLQSDIEFLLQEEEAENERTLAMLNEKKSALAALISEVRKEPGLVPWNDLVNDILIECQGHIDDVIEQAAVEGMLKHLEDYEQLNVNPEVMEERFKDVRNESIFFGHKSAIRDFCMGLSSLQIAGIGEFKLEQNKPCSKADFLKAITRIAKLPDQLSYHQSSMLKALLKQLHLDVGVKFDVLQCHNRYAFSQCDSLRKVSEFLGTICICCDTKAEKAINELDLRCMDTLEAHSLQIKNILRETKGTITASMFVFPEDNFKMTEEEFHVVRSLLVDAGIIKSSIFEELTRRENRNPDLERILTIIFQNDGCVTDQNLAFKNSREGSQELLDRLLEMRVLKPVKVDFKLGRAKYVPEVYGGNHWKDSSDPAKRMEQIQREVEVIVSQVFNLQRKSDSAHEADEWLAGGLAQTESENKDLDEKIETVTRALRFAAGTIKYLPEIKVNHRTLHDIFKECKGGKVPPELEDYVSICFDLVLDYKEDRGFDWDCFLCAMMGVAQVVAGVALEIMSGGVCHLVAQTLIAEGVGDIVFAINSSIQGNFSWKSYAQHKVQSLILSVLTLGVGTILSKGAQATKMSVGLATKTALFKAVFKEMAMHAVTGITDALVTIGADEISNVIMDELANTHFMKFFEAWTLDDNQYKEKVCQAQQQIEEIYQDFGGSSKQEVCRCLQSALEDLSSGSIGDKIYNHRSKIISAVTKSLSLAAQKLSQSGNDKAKFLATIAKLTSKAVKIATYVKNFAQLSNVCLSYFVHLCNKLAKLHKTLRSKVDGLAANNSGLDAFAPDLLNVDPVELALQDMSEAEKKMHLAFTQKVKVGFLQPAVSSVLRMAAKPVTEMLTSPFKDARDNLARHIDEQAEQLLQGLDIDVSNGGGTSLSPKQLKALEQRGDVLTADRLVDLFGDSVVELAIDGQSVERLVDRYGDGLRFMIRKGQICAIPPTFEKRCEDVYAGLVPAGIMELENIAAITGVTFQVNFKDDPMKAPAVIGGKILIQDHCLSDLFDEHSKWDDIEAQENIRLEIHKNSDGSQHYTTVVLSPEGKRIHVDLGSAGQACAMQHILFLQKYREFTRNGHDSALQQAISFVCNQENVRVFMHNAKMSALSNPSLRNQYYSGGAKALPELVGGVSMDGDRINLSYDDAEELRNFYKSGKKPEKRPRLFPLVAGSYPAQEGIKYPNDVTLGFDHLVGHAYILNQLCKQANQEDTITFQASLNEFLNANENQEARDIFFRSVSDGGRPLKELDSDAVFGHILPIIEYNPKNVFIAPKQYGKRDQDDGNGMNIDRYLLSQAENLNEISQTAQNVLQYVEAYRNKDQNQHSSILQMLGRMPNFGWNPTYDRVGGIWKITGYKQNLTSRFEKPNDDHMRYNLQSGEFHRLMS